ncbi:MAG: CopG family ribbon-helix-helix protein [Gammaproteobacteria bacterium]
MSTTMTIRVEADLKQRLEKLATATQRSKSFLAAEAIKDFIELNEWQVQEIQRAVAEADAGEFAEDSEVQKVLKKWGVDGS